MSKENLIKSKRFVVRKSLVGKGQLIEFTNKKGGKELVQQLVMSRGSTYEVQISKYYLFSL